jgi:hypothetical protein
MSTVASYEYDPVRSVTPDVIHIADNIYAIAYRGPGTAGWLKTVSISDDGLTMSTVASYEYSPGTGVTPNIIHVAGDTYAIAYMGPGSDGWLKTIGITTSEALAAAARHRFTGGMMHRPVH